MLEKKELKHQPSAEINDIFYPRYWFVSIVISILLLVGLVDLWLYNDFYNNQEEVISETIDAAAEEFNFNLIQIENKLLQFSKYVSLSEIKGLSSEDLKNSIGFNSADLKFIEDIKILEDSKNNLHFYDFNSDEFNQHSKKIIFVDNKLYLIIRTNILDSQTSRKGESGTNIQLHLNIEKLTGEFLNNDYKSFLLLFRFIIGNSNDNDVVEYILTTNNHIIKYVNNSSLREIEQSPGLLSSDMKLLQSKHLLNKDNWQIRAYIKNSFIHKYIQKILLISFIVIFLVLFIAKLIYKKICFLESQKRKITKDKNHFQQRAEITLASTNDGVLITNSTAQILYINPIVQNYLHVDLSDVYLKRFDELIPELYIITSSNSDKQKFSEIKLILPEQDRYFDIEYSKLYDEQTNFIGYAIFMHDITTSFESQKKLNYLAYYDEPTKLPNKLSLLDFYGKTIEQEGLVLQDVYKLYTVVFNSPSLRNINDTIGYENGDRALQNLLYIVKKYLSDNNIHNSLYRIGAYTFAISFLYDRKKHGKSAVLYITNFISSLIYELLRPIHINEQDLHLQFNFGVSIYPDNFSNADELDPASLLRYSEIAMSMARRKGPNKYVFYSDDLNSSIQERFVLENELRSAVNENKLELLYHPQLELNSNKLRGFEALVRWQRQNGNMVSPGTFIPLLEKSGLIVTVGDWILRKACEQGVSFIKRGVDFETIAVNISGLQLQNENFISRLEHIVSDTGFPKEKLELEVTENILLDNPDNVIRVLDKIRKLGVKIALDDFGTGFSSLTYLKDLPLDYLKIDKAFVSGIETGDTRLLEAIIAISKTMNLITVAEGVETQQQVDFLRKNLCDIIQGYYISKPMAFSAVIEKFT